MPTLQALADAFRVNKTVTKVDLEKNKIRDEGLKARAPLRGPRLGGCGTVGLRGETESELLAQPLCAIVEIELPTPGPVEFNQIL